jgi:hypothetical protein
VLGEGLGVKRSKKKVDTSKAEQVQHSEDQPSARLQADVSAAVSGDRVPDVASSSGSTSTSRRAVFSASSNNSKSSGSSSPLWEEVGDCISGPLTYGEGRNVETLAQSPAGRGDGAFAGSRALGTLNSTTGQNLNIEHQEELLSRLFTIGSHWKTNTPLPHTVNVPPAAKFAATVSIGDTAFVNTALVARKQPVSTEAPPWEAALASQLPVAASLTRVFGNNGGESSSDSGEDGICKAAQGNRTTRK